MSNLRDPFAEGSSPSAPQPAPRPATPVRGSLVSPFEHVKHLALWLNVVLLGLVFLGGLAIVADSWFGGHDRPDDYRVDARFVPLGRTYHAELAKVYAHAWQEGAKNLDSGAGPAAAIDGVAKSWEAGRLDLFEKVVTPEFSKVVPEGKSDKDLTSADRAKLAAAWRGFAKGLGGGR